MDERSLTVTVAELLITPTLKNLKLISGFYGVHREISTVTVIDTPDGFQWLTGNEVVITTTYALEKTEEAFCNFITSIIVKGASALIVKTDRYLKVIPENAKKLCDEKNFPLIYCPESYAFADIINPTLSSIISKQEAQLRKANNIHKSFLELAINDCRIQEILQTLSTLIKVPTAYVDTVFHKVYFSDTSNENTILLNTMSYKQILTYFKEHYKYIEVANKKQFFGFIIILDSNISEPTTDLEPNPDFDSHVYHTALEYASIVIILRMQILVSNHMIEEKYRSSFVGDLVLNNVKTLTEIETRAHLYGWDFNAGGFIVIIDINNFKKYYLKELSSKEGRQLQNYVNYIFDTSIQYMHATFPSAHYYSQSDYISFLIGEKLSSVVQEKLKNVFHQIQYALEVTVPFTVSMGVGTYIENIIDIHHSYEQARQVIQAVYQTHQFNRITFYDQIGLYKLLFSVAYNKEAIEFCDKYIQPLREYDIQHHANLIETIQVIVNCGWNLKAASDALYLHYNSVKYRFQNICEILDMDLRNPEKHTEVELALKLFFLQKESRY